MANIDEFDYMAEEAKKNFQCHISSLLEVRGILDKKLSTSIANKKDGSFFTNQEIEVLKDWLMQSCTSLMGDYTQLDRTNRLTNKLYRCAAELAARRTPNLKDLAA